ncbi:hypothetical protein CCR75_004527 [Bremia lactucae]|uniref:Selenoprotein K n=1 Tax=Bremia lactucae TaxID=4779 RepID=A0A976FIL8_BRELC|nr:hypothetical protein CCR75_004527 [Bremia lactucae]
MMTYCRNYFTLSSANLVVNLLIMTYITGGDVVEKRSPWRFSIVTDLFWGAIDFVGLLTHRLHCVQTATLVKDGERLMEMIAVRVRVKWDR